MHGGNTGGELFVVFIIITVTVVAHTITVVFIIIAPALNHALIAKTRAIQTADKKSRHKFSLSYGLACKKKKSEGFRIFDFSKGVQEEVAKSVGPCRKPHGNTPE